VSSPAAAPGAAGEIVFAGVSKFYGEVLGVNRIDLAIPAGITSLVGPNGSGKTTLMNLAVGLLRPTRGTVRVLGLSPDRPEELFRRVGYCTQYDSFPRGLTGWEFVVSYLRLHGHDRRRAGELAERALSRVNLLDAARRKVAGYSKGMRQRVKLAQAICHDPQVLLLDEPLNGLDPLARSETIALFRALAAEGRHLVLSSHILHEVDLLSDRVVLMSHGYLVAQGAIQGVRDEMEEHPLQLLIRCPRPGALAARAFAQDHVVEAKIHPDGKGLFVRTRDADAFYLLLNRIVAEEGLEIDAVAPADDDVQAVYEYLIGSDG
jgi:ABC-2 type transport system ATP-binding protein